MRGISASTAGAARNATAYYRQNGGGNAAQKAYTKGANSAIRAGKSGMAVHKAGLRSASMS
jgi:hypothetical protein